MEWGLAHCTFHLHRGTINRKEVGIEGQSKKHKIRSWSSGKARSGNYVCLRIFPDTVNQRGPARQLVEPTIDASKNKPSLRNPPFQRKSELILGRNSFKQGDNKFVTIGITSRIEISMILVRL